MKTNRLPAWATSVMQRMFDVSRLEAAIAINMKEREYGA
jgi:hypothetical protein